MFKNVANQGVYIYAHDTAADEPKTGDAANITANISKDGGGVAGTNDANPTEIGGGIYWFDLLQEETNADSISIISSSSTADIQIDPLIVYTDTVMRGTDEANKVEPDAAGTIETLLNNSENRHNYQGSASVADGDLCYMDSDNIVQPASVQSDLGSEPSNQEAFARNFVGVAGESDISNRVYCYERCVRSFTCPSDTYTVGQLVGVDENGGGNGLLDQTVAKVTNRMYAIGRVAVAVPVADTTVQVQVFGRSPSIDWDEARRLDALLDTLIARLTAARAGYLDNLNVGGNVASQSDVQGITQAQRVRILPPAMMERPDSGSTAFRVYCYCYNESHEAEDLDASPTITVENDQGTDRSANLSAVTHDGTGIYYAAYTIADSHAIEALLFKVAATEGGTTVNYAQPSHVVDTTAVDFTAADRTKLDAIDTLTKAAGDGDLAAMKTILNGLHNFDPANDTVAEVTLVGTTTTNTDMRGTDEANTVEPDAAGTAATLIGDLQTHGDSTWPTATGFSTHDAAAVKAALGTGSSLTACLTATGFALASAVPTAKENADALLKRDVTNVEEDAPLDSMAGVILAAFHSNTNDKDGYLTVYQTDNTTAFDNATGIDVSAGASPVVGMAHER